jgi:multiple sugar transport system ATP-binding protein
MLGIRPEDFEDASLESDAPPDRRVEAVADLTEPLGSEVLVYFSVEATGIISSAVTADAAEGDADIYIAGDENGDAAGGLTRLVARVSPRTRIAVGSKIELAVDTSRLYFFDPETREAI